MGLAFQDLVGFPDGVGRRVGDEVGVGEVEVDVRICGTSAAALR